MTKILKTYISIIKNLIATSDCDEYISKLLEHNICCEKIFRYAMTNQYIAYLHVLVYENKFEYIYAEHIDWMLLMVTSRNDIILRLAGHGIFPCDDEVYATMLQYLRQQEIHTTYEIIMESATVDNKIRYNIIVYKGYSDKKQLEYWYDAITEKRHGDVIVMYRHKVIPNSSECRIYVGKECANFEEFWTMLIECKYKQLIRELYTNSITPPTPLLHIEIGKLIYS